MIYMLWSLFIEESTTDPPSNFPVIEVCHWIIINFIPSFVCVFNGAWLFFEEPWAIVLC